MHSKVERCGYADRQRGDIISLLLFYQNKESRFQSGSVCDDEEKIPTYVRNVQAVPCGHSSAYDDSEAYVLLFVAGLLFDLLCDPHREQRHHFYLCSSSLP
jgi:hypothetical protein